MCLFAASANTASDREALPGNIICSAKLTAYLPLFKMVYFSFSSAVAIYNTYI
jgi:hypothetical protein